MTGPTAAVGKGEPQVPSVTDCPCSARGCAVLDRKPDGALAALASSQPLGTQRSGRPVGKGTLSNAAADNSETWVFGHGVLPEKHKGGLISSEEQSEEIK